jgi:hypothetical protein
MAAMLPQRVFGRVDERQRADVKSQRPDTPTLVSPRGALDKRVVVKATRLCLARRWPTSPAHQGDCV